MRISLSTHNKLVTRSLECVKWPFGDAKYFVFNVMAYKYKTQKHMEQTNVIEEESNRVKTILFHSFALSRLLHPLVDVQNDIMRSSYCQQTNGTQSQS